MIGLLYASTSLEGKSGFELLQKAVEALLSSVDITPAPTVLWSLQYEHRSGVVPASLHNTSNSRTLNLPGSTLDLAFDDAMLDRVKEVWERIMGDDTDGFLVFADREANIDDDE